MSAAAPRPAGDVALHHPGVLPGEATRGRPGPVAARLWSALRRLAESLAAGGRLYARANEAGRIAHRYLSMTDSQLAAEGLTREGVRRRVMDLVMHDF